MPANDTQSLARRIAEKIWDKMLAYKLVPHDPKEAAIADVATRAIQHAWKQHAEQIIAAELAEYDRKMREALEYIHRLAQQYFLSSRAAEKSQRIDKIRIKAEEILKG